jgi:hypothetical protein
MAKIPEKQPEVVFIDNPHAPEVFADAATGIAFLGGNIRLTFESLRVNHVTTPGPVNRVVMARLVMPIAAAEALQQLLSEYLGKLKAQADVSRAQGPTTLQ